MHLPSSCPKTRHRVCARKRQFQNRMVPSRAVVAKCSSSDDAPAAEARDAALLSTRGTAATDKTLPKCADTSRLRVSGGHALSENPCRLWHLPFGCARELEGSTSYLTGAAAPGEMSI